jgi:hypothetical protein
MSLSGATSSFRETLIASVSLGFDCIALYLTLSASGGDKTRRQNGNNSKPRKNSKNAARPHRQLHALLGVVELEDS